MKELLEQLESWRAYQRILLTELSKTESDPHRIKDAFFAWAIEDNKLALILNHEINSTTKSTCPTHSK